MQLGTLPIPKLYHGLPAEGLARHCITSAPSLGSAPDPDVSRASVPGTVLRQSVHTPYVLVPTLSIHR